MRLGLLGGRRTRVSLSWTKIEGRENRQRTCNKLDMVPEPVPRRVHGSDPDVALGGGLGDIFENASTSDGDGYSDQDESEDANQHQLFAQGNLDPPENGDGKAEN